MSEQDAAPKMFDKINLISPETATLDVVNWLLEQDEAGGFDHATGPGVIKLLRMARKLEENHADRIDESFAKDALERDRQRIIAQDLPYDEYGNLRAGHKGPGPEWKQ